MSEQQREHSIIMSSESVESILRGEKTQTRRIIREISWQASLYSYSNTIDGNAIFESQVNNSPYAKNCLRVRKAAFVATARRADLIPKWFIP